jgi:hypothetical protein
MQRSTWKNWLKTRINQRARRAGRVGVPSFRVSMDRLESRDVPSAFTPGDLVAYRVGTGTGSLTSAATAVFLDEFSPTGTLVQSIPMPTTVSGANHALTESGTTFGEGLINLTNDGRYLLATGYDAPVGTAAVTGTSPATNNRVIARVDSNGVIDTTTGQNDATAAIRSAASPDGVTIWTSGTTTTGSIRLSQFGVSGASTSITTSFTSLRGLSTFGNQLYTSNSAAGLDGLASVGNGLPTTSGQTTTVLPGFPTTGTAPFPSPFQFVFSPDGSTIYVGDTRVGTGTPHVPSTACGLQKWTFSGGFWNLQYTINPAPDEGIVSVVGDFSGPNPVFYGVTSEFGSVQPKLVKIVDNGSASSSTVTTLMTVPTNEAYRGVSFVPKPIGATSDTVGIVSDGSPVTVGSTVTFTATVSGAAAPSGWISFRSGTSTLAVVPLTAANSTSSQAQFSISSLPVGNDAVTAVYGGDGTYVAGSNSMTQVVNGTNTVTGVTSNVPLPTANNVSVTFTATIAPQSGSVVPTGTVTFYDNGFALNTTPINVTAGSGSNGTAQVTVTTNAIQAAQELTPGSHTITAVFTPSGAFVGSTGTMIQNVKPNAFGGGDLLVYRAGDGTNALTLNGNTVYIDEYTQAAGQTAPVQSIVMPTSSVTGGNQALITCTQQSQEGQLSLSGDGSYVYFTGYDAAPGGSIDMHTSASAAISRTIGRIKYDGTIDTSMALSDLADGGSVRGVSSPDNVHVYATGSTSGVRYVASYAPGITTSTQIDDASNGTNGAATGVAQTLNNLVIANGQLYVTDSANNGAVKVATVGTGLPMTSGQTDTILPGLPTGTGTSPGFPVGVFFAHLQTGPVTGPDTMYVCDDGATFFGGTITKWSLVSGSWTLVDTIQSNGTGITSPIPSFDHISGTVNNSTGTVTLFPTYGNGGNSITGPGYLYSITDTGGYNNPIPNQTVTTLATLPVGSNEVFRGAVVVPTQTASPPHVSTVVVGDGTAQRSEVRQIQVTFDGPVTFTGGNANAAAAFQLLHTQYDTTTYNTQVANLQAAVSTNGSGQTVVTLTFTTTGNAASEVDPLSVQSTAGGPTTASLGDGRFTLTILASNISGPGGALAGNGTTAGTNYVSSSTSGPNGYGDIYRLFGDIDGNGLDDLTDLTAFRNTYNSSLASGPYVNALDADNDAVIDLDDLTAFRNHYNHHV